MKQQLLGSLKELFHLSPSQFVQLEVLGNVGSRFSHLLKYVLGKYQSRPIQLGAFVILTKVGKCLLNSVGA